MRGIYQYGGSPDPIVLSAVESSLSSVALLLGMTLSRPAPTNAVSPPGQDMHANDQAPLPRPPGPPSPQAASRQQPLRVLLSARTGSLGLASLELGAFSGVGLITQVYGLSHVPATTASFIIQSTAVITPCIAALAGDAISRTAWAACGVAAVGTLLTAVDGAAGAAGGLDGAAISGPQALGGVAVLMAAVCYSLVTFRISVLAQGHRPVDLAAGKTLGMTAVAVAAAAVHIVTVSLASAPDSDGRVLGCAQSVAAVWPALWPQAMGQPVAAGLLVWASLGCGALAAALQMYGQGAISAARTQVIFTLIPVWSALIAVTALHEEPFHATGWTGAACILGAGLLVARDSNEETAS